MAKLPRVLVRELADAILQNRQALDPFTDDIRTLIGGGVPREKAIIDPQQYSSPGIWKSPTEKVADVEPYVAPENPLMKEMWGTDRQDLFDIAMSRQGNIEPDIGLAPGAKGSYVTDNIMTPKNAQRLQDDMVATMEGSPELTKGMVGWYVMDPVYQHMKSQYGAEIALDMYKRFNNVTGIYSSGSPVSWELRRGTAALMAEKQGKLDDWLEFGGLDPDKRGKGYPQEFSNVMGHPYHQTAHRPATERFFETGEHGMKSAKVPLYIQSSGVPETGFQTKWPVPDAHFANAIGAADVNRQQQFSRSLKKSEYGPRLGDWWSDEVAGPVGLTGVGGQGLTWGLNAPQTGVKSKVGKPKLELLTDSIEEMARRARQDPYDWMRRVMDRDVHASAGGGGIFA